MYSVYIHVHVYIRVCPKFAVNEYEHFESSNTNVYIIVRAFQTSKATQVRLHSDMSTTVHLALDVITTEASDVDIVGTQSAMSVNLYSLCYTEFIYVRLLFNSILS